MSLLMENVNGVIEMLKPGLKSIFELFLRTIDEIDFDDLVVSLQCLVKFYADEIGPYARELSQKLGNIFVKLMKSRDSEEEILLDAEEETEDGLTACSCMATVNRILESVSGQDNHKQFFYEVDQALQEAFYLGLCDPNETSLPDALNCLRIITFNQTDALSPTMWKFTEYVTSMLLNGSSATYRSALLAYLNTFICRAGNELQTQQVNGQNYVDAIS